jgi:hypothetical protein
MLPELFLELIVTNEEVLLRDASFAATESLND